MQINFQPNQSTLLLNFSVKEPTALHVSAAPGGLISVLPKVTGNLQRRKLNRITPVQAAGLNALFNIIIRLLSAVYMDESTGKPYVLMRTTQWIMIIEPVDVGARYADRVARLVNTHLWTKLTIKHFYVVFIKSR